MTKFNFYGLKTMCNLSWSDSQTLKYALGMQLENQSVYFASCRRIINCIPKVFIVSVRVFKFKQ